MSQYLNVFVRDNDGKLTHICDFNRSSAMYDILHTYAPYEKVSTVDWNRALRTASNKEDAARDNILKLQKSIEMVQKCENSVSDKMDYIDSCVLYINEYENDLDKLQQARTYITLLQDISETTNGVLVGIECGDDPEVV